MAAREKLILLIVNCYVMYMLRVCLKTFSYKTIFENSFQNNHLEPIW